MARKKESEEDYILQLREKREKLNSELIETAIQITDLGKKREINELINIASQIADLGKKLNELKVELKITETKLRKFGVKSNGT